MTATQHPASPRDVALALLRTLARGDASSATQYYDDDAEIIVKFSIPTPATIRGLPAIARIFDETPDWRVRRMYRNIEVTNLVVHETLDPEVVIVEWDYLTRIEPEDRTVVNGNIIVVRVREGMIVKSRDYHDHVSRAIADDELPQLIAKLQSLDTP